MSSASRILAERIRDELQLESEDEIDANDVFETEPPLLTTFIRDARYLANPRLSDIQFAAVRHAEQIYLPETYPTMVELFGPEWAPVRFVNEIDLEWGKGSGKDHVCRLTSARVAHLLLCLKSPQLYYGMPPQDTIHTLNIAASSGQANRAFFKPLRALVKRAKCFDGLYETSRTGEPGVGSVFFKKQVEMISGHSSAETQEGLNLMLGIADELSAFKTKDEVARNIRQSGREPSTTAESIVEMMISSGRTRFLTFKVMCISYPRFKNDAIQQRRKFGKLDMERKGPSSRHFADGPRCTWEVNPRVRSKEDFASDYEKNPAMAAAKYECKPEMSTKRYFRNSVAISQAFGESKPPPLIIEYYWGKPEETDTEDETGKAPPEREGWQVRLHISPDLIPMAGAIYCMHGDLAISQDRAGVAMSHVRTFNKVKHKRPDESIIIEDRPTVKLDFVTSFEADIAAQPVPREVQIRWFRKLVWELLFRGFNIERVTYDGFQSTDSMQILSSRGVDSFRVSTDKNNDAWTNLRDLIYDGRYEGYWDELTVDELSGLMTLPNGKVDHPAGGSKDQADAVAGSALGAVELGGSEGARPQEADPLSPSQFGVGAPFGDSADEMRRMLNMNLSADDLRPPAL